MNERKTTKNVLSVMIEIHSESRKGLKNDIRFYDSLYTSSFKTETSQNMHVNASTHTFLLCHAIIQTFKHKRLSKSVRIYPPRLECYSVLAVSVVHVESYAKMSEYLRWQPVGNT
jgi:hypothetical protein